MSHLVCVAPAFLNEDPNHLIMVVTGSLVDGEIAILIRQEWVSPCSQKFLHTGEVTLLAGEVERCGFHFVPYVEVCFV